MADARVELLLQQQIYNVPGGNRRSLHSGDKTGSKTRPQEKEYNGLLNLRLECIHIEKAIMELDRWELHRRRHYWRRIPLDVP
jgi:hypothetical protein